MMTPAERERAAAYLAETRENLLRFASGLSPAQLHYKPGPDRWSVAECLEHIIFVEGFILAKINDVLLREAATSAPAMSDDDIVHAVVGRTSRLKGPDHVMPTGRWAHDQLLPEFQATRARTSQFAASTNAPLRQHGFPHPVFGHIDCYQWLLLIAAHGERHRAQAEEVMAEPGFPRAAAACSSLPAR